MPQVFKYYVEAEDPDVLVLTETKVCAPSAARSARAHGATLNF